MSEPLISILTASYNSVEGLKKTVASVETQTFRDFEHVVIDGGSTDGSAEFLSEQGDNVNWISEPDEGIADAMNKGIRLARGDWILVLQAEDTFVDQHSLAGAVRRLGVSQPIVCFSVIVIDGRTRRVVAPSRNRMRHWFKPLPHQGAFCRRSLFDAVGPFDTSFRITMDFEWFLRALRSGIEVKVFHDAVSVMPSTGVSSRRKWRHVRERFREERRSHMMNCPNAAMRALYLTYWPIYLFYRRARSIVGAGT